MLCQDIIKYIIDKFDKVYYFSIPTNGTIPFKLEEKYMKRIRFQISLYKEFISQEVELINKFDLDSHLLLTEQNIDDFNFISYIFNHIDTNKIWVSLDLKFKSTDKNKTKIDNFFSFLYSYITNNNQTFNRIFLQNYKTNAGKECDHFYNNAIYISSSGEYKNCSHLSLKQNKTKDSLCDKCENIYCRCCICKLDIIERDIQCYFYNTVKEVIESGLL